MDTDQEKKINTIVDKLLVKSRAGKCEWHSLTNKKNCYVLTFENGAQIKLYKDIDIDDMKTWIHLDVLNNNREHILNFEFEPILKHANVIKLYDHVKAYHDQAVATLLDKLIEDLDNLTNDDKKKPSIPSNMGFKEIQMMKKSKPFWKRYSDLVAKSNISLKDLKI